MNQSETRPETSNGWVNFGPPWLRVVLTILLTPPMLIYSMIMMAYFIAILVPWGWFHFYRKDRTFRRRLRAAGRIVDFATIVEPLQAGRGTVFACAAPQGLIGDLWWLPEAAEELRNSPLPTFRQFMALKVPENHRLLHGMKSAVERCDDLYLRLDQGRASLIEKEPADSWSILEAAPEHCVLMTYTTSRTATLPK